MSKPTAEEIRSAVVDRYGKAALEVSAGCGCGSTTTDLQLEDCSTDRTARLIGRPLYQQVDEVPETALAASLGCGNPTALADLRPGDTVLDLGSGGGLDVLLSARRVGPDGMAYGLDLTPEMLELARRNQAEAGVTNVEFLAGEIEKVPLPDNSVDVIISNCVVNLSTDKRAVFREAFRVLRPGGRLAISDIVLTRPLTAPYDEMIAAWTGCIAGALVDRDLAALLAETGFQDADIEVVQTWDLPDVPELQGVVTSSFIRARKPA